MWSRLHLPALPSTVFWSDVAEFMGINLAFGRSAFASRREYFTAAPPPPQTVATSWREAIGEDRDHLTAVIGKLLQGIPEKGETVVPADLAAITLLLDPPPNFPDMAALDALLAAFPKTTKLSHNRVLLAIARAVTRGFGTENRLPLTAAKAWSMLDPAFFTDELARQFDAIASFILGWQNDKRDFLLLDPSEVSLIEYFFEHLHPRRQGILVAKTMDFKVLSTRRMGLLRRIPIRVEQILRNVNAPTEMEAAVTYAKDCLALLDHIARPGGFQPIIDEAKVCAARIVKAVQKATTPQAAPALAAPPGGAPGGAPAIAPPAQAVVTPAPPPQIAPQPNAHDPVAAAPAVAVEPQAPGPRPLPTAPPARLSKRHRTDAVIRVLRGEDINDIAHALGVKPSAIESWTESFISGGATALTSRAKGPEKADSPLTAPAQSGTDTETIEDLKRRVEQLTAMMEQLAKPNQDQ